MAIVYRPARAEELARAQELVAASINDLTERHGFGRIASARPPHFQTFSLQDDPAGLWTAEEDGEIVGFAFSWVCGSLWFLAELFVAPTQQGRGIGNELLKRTLDQASKAGAADKALITFAFNTVSQGLYIRHGLFPRVPLYLLKAERETLLARLRKPEVDGTPIGAIDLPDLADIDRQALGFSREKHHRHLITDGTIRAALFRAGGKIVGYAYVNADGHIGPLAVTRSDAMSAVFQAALAIAAEGGATQATAIVPGTSERALNVAADHGMRILLPLMLMSTREFGDWTRYLPRNPGFM